MFADSWKSENAAEGKGAAAADNSLSFKKQLACGSLEWKRWTKRSFVSQYRNSSGKSAPGWTRVSIPVGRQQSPAGELSGMLVGRRDTNLNQLFHCQSFTFSLRPHRIPHNQISLIVSKRWFHSIPKFLRDQVDVSMHFYCYLSVFPPDPL